MTEPGRGGGVGRYAPVLAAAAAGVALVGFLRGISETRPLPGRAAPSERGAPEGVPPAVSYAEIRAAGLGPNAGWRSDLKTLSRDRPGLFDLVVRTEAMRSEALADRARNRAFDTAPPTIPHPAGQESAAACLACHGQGLKVGGRVATRMSHAPFTSCTQCHVEGGQTGLPWKGDDGGGNGFAGLTRSGPGERAYPGAPPTIPHTTWMREDCLSCHGPVARPGLRTTHPYLTNCTQCHAPSAALDQVGFAEGRP